MKDLLLTTSPDVGLFLLRLVLALVIFPHGAQKLLGWFGGYGLKGTMGYFTGQLKIPTLFGYLAILAEFLGAVLLATGTLTRIAAFGILSVMLVAAWTVHRGNGFFMNWSGTKKGEWFEFHIMAAGVALALTIVGAGKWSVDALVASW